MYKANFENNVDVIRLRILTHVYIFMNMTKKLDLTRNSFHLQHHEYSVLNILYFRAYNMHWVHFCVYKSCKNV